MRFTSLALVGALRAPNASGGRALRIIPGEPVGDFVFAHAGRNDAAISTELRIHPGPGDVIVVLESGADLLATGAWRSPIANNTTLVLSTDSHPLKFLTGMNPDDARGPQR